MSASQASAVVSPAVQALDAIRGWNARHAAAGVVGREGTVARYGEDAYRFRWASVTKPATALAALVALEEGIVDLDEAAGPPGATVRHLLAHASGLPLNGGPPIAPPGRRRIYSNQGFEVLAELVGERAETPFGDYLRAAVLEPLGTAATLEGSPAWGLVGSLDEALSLAFELLVPTLVAAETLAEATDVVFPGLAGVLPGFGRYEPNDWGLGFELRDGKRPHWTGERNSARTFGHFGAAGTFLWVDPEPGVACVCLTDREFGDWAKHAWPHLSDAVLAEAGASHR
jgi:CubicO group peptidase (beta-lactamase class C family)